MTFKLEKDSWIGSKLARRTLFKMGLRITVVITIAAILSYYHIFSLLNDQNKDSLKKYITERGQKESAIFLNAERNHEEFKQTFLEVWPQRQDENNQERFDQLFIRKNDDTLRIHQDAFEGLLRNDGTTSKHISGYIGANAPRNNRFYNKLLLSYELIDRYADAWTMDYANLYVAMPENVNLVYWPGIPWGNQAKSTLDVNTEEWVYVANQENNPSRESVWTGLYYDMTADEWMVSLETPVDLDGLHLINIGHDILLNTLFNRVFDDKLEGTYNFIFREDGRIIAHPDLVDVLHQHEGVLHVSEINDPELKNIINVIKLDPPPVGGQGVILENPQTNALLAVTRIAGPDWFFVTYYPKSLLSSVAMQAAYIVSVIGLISLIVELVILFIVLRKQVLKPVAAFGRFSKGMGKHDFNAIDQLKQNEVSQREDEMGQLASSMLDMASTISKHEKEQEKLVVQRTKELNQTIAMLDKESKERKDVVALLQTIAKDVSGLQGENYFHTLSMFLAESLEADFVIICRLSEDKKHIYALSATLNNKHIDNINYPVEHTPCEIVIKEGSQVYNGNVREKFPLDQDLVDLDLDSYIGIPLYNSKGEAIGHLAVMKKGLFAQDNKVSMVIESVSSRAANELLRHVYEETILRQAQSDPLTKLPNRILFMDRLAQAILQAKRKQQKLAVIFIDLDNFKLVNDEHGHEAGDELLVALTQRFSECVRQADTIARMGGDEFIILLTNIDDMYGPEIVVRKIQKRLNEEITIANTTLFPSCSIGISIYPDDSQEEETLIKNADMAMYCAKELGNNHFQFFTQKMNAFIEKSRQIEQDLHQAIRNQDFELYYQPIISLLDGHIHKVEALIRWNHSSKGLIMPNDLGVTKIGLFQIHL